MYTYPLANDYAVRLLAAHKQYATRTGLDLLARQIDELEKRLADAHQAGQCLLSLVWGGGLLRSRDAQVFPSERIVTVLLPGNVLRRCIHPRLEPLGLESIAVPRRSDSTLYQERGMQVIEEMERETGLEPAKSAWEIRHSFEATAICRSGRL